MVVQHTRLPAHQARIRHHRTAVLDPHIDLNNRLAQIHVNEYSSLGRTANSNSKHGVYQ
jgi:hypothetical protein